MATLRAHPRPLKWDKTHEVMLTLVFEGRLSYPQIAQRVGVSESTVQRWLKHPEFVAKLAEKRANLEAALDGYAYVRKEQRIIALSQVAEEARQDWDEHRHLVEVRMIGRDPETGEMLTITNEAVNKAAHDAFRAALDDIAKEKGERKQQTEVSGSLDVRAQVQFYLPEPELPPADIVDSTPAATAPATIAPTTPAADREAQDATGRTP